MVKRLLIILAVAAISGLFISSGSLADDSIPASAADLGPQTQIPANRGGSNADGGALQPAGNNPLQSATGASNGLAAPSANTLQAPATTDAQLQVLAGESDGEPIDMTEESASHWGWLWLSLLTGIMAAGGYIVWRDRQHFRQRDAAMAASATPSPLDTP